MAVRGFFGSLVQATKFPDNVALVEPVGHLALDLVDLSHLVDVAIEDGSGGTSTLRPGQSTRSGAVAIKETPNDLGGRPRFIAEMARPVVASDAELIELHLGVVASRGPSGEAEARSQIGAVALAR